MKAKGQIRSKCFFRPSPSIPSVTEDRQLSHMTNIGDGVGRLTHPGECKKNRLHVESSQSKSFIALALKLPAHEKFVIPSSLTAGLTGELAPGKGRGKTHRTLVNPWPKTHLHLQAHPRMHLAPNEKASRQIHAPCRVYHRKLSSDHLIKFRSVAAETPP